jgi:hypothetical protein
MIDNQTDAAETTELRDDELEQASGGLKAAPQAKPLPKGGDPCDGGE